MGLVTSGLLWNVHKFGSDMTISGPSIFPGIQTKSDINWKELRDKDDMGIKRKYKKTRIGTTDDDPSFQFEDYDAFRAASSNSQQRQESPLCRGFDHTIKRPQHGCQANLSLITVFCNFENLRIDASKINMVAKGGEILSTVMGRDEMDEYPTYEVAAFATPTKPNIEIKLELGSPLRDTLHYMKYVLGSMEWPRKKNQELFSNLDMTCQQTFSGTTLFITRYEYVNLFHTLTDWWNAFFVLPRNHPGVDDDTSAGLSGIAKPDRVVFLDGHAEGILDSVWETLFGSTHFIQHMDNGKSGRICFERAIFVPPGYKSPLFNTDRSRTMCPRERMTKTFSDFVLKQYNLQDTKVIKGNVVVIDRQPYVSHPRSNPDDLERQFDPNELKNLQAKLKEIPGVTVQLVRLENLSFGEQLKLLRETHVLIGIHGAALSHLIFMDEDHSHTIEFRPEFQIDFFEDLSMWKGIDHSVIEYFAGLSDHEINRAFKLVTKYVAG